MINFFAEGVDIPEIDTSKYEEWLAAVAKKEKHPLENVNYIFCNDDYLLDMNQKYLQHDTLTDIITFPMQASPLIADVFISVDRVKDNAIKFKVSTTTELRRVMAHGLLHLIGYDDKDADNKAKMTAKENESLQLFLETLRLIS